MSESVGEVRLPARIQKTGSGWDALRSAYKVQLGTHERTIAYVWVPDDRHSDDATISDAVEIANRLCEGWNAHPKHIRLTDEAGRG